MLCFNLFLWDRHICVSTPRVHTKMFCGGHWWGSLSPRSCSTGCGCVLWLNCCCLCLHQWHGGEFLKTNSSANDIIDSRRLSFRNNNLFKNFATPPTYYKNTICLHIQTTVSKVVLTLRSHWIILTNDLMQ